MRFPETLESVALRYLPHEEAWNDFQKDYFKIKSELNVRFNEYGKRTS